MSRLQPRSNRTETLLPYTPHFRARAAAQPLECIEPVEIIGRRSCRRHERKDRQTHRQRQRPRAEEASRGIVPPCHRERDEQRQRLETDAVISDRSEEHTSELQSIMRTSYAVFCLKKKTNNSKHNKQERSQE